MTNEDALKLVEKMIKQIELQITHLELNKRDIDCRIQGLISARDIAETEALSLERMIKNESKEKQNV